MRVRTPHHTHFKTVIQGGQRGFEMLEARAVPKTQDAIDLGHVPAQSARQFGLAHAGVPHRLVERDLRDREGWQRRDSPGELARRRGNGSPVLHVSLECRQDAVGGANGDLLLTSVTTKRGSSQRVHDRANDDEHVNHAARIRPGPEVVEPPIGSPANAPPASRRDPGLRRAARGVIITARQMPDLDTRVRLAAFAFLEEQVRLAGEEGSLRRDLLQAGFIFEGRRVSLVS